MPNYLQQNVGTLGIVGTLTHKAAKSAKNLIRGSWHSYPTRRGHKPPHTPGERCLQRSPAAKSWAIGYTVPWPTARNRNVSSKIKAMYAIIRQQITDIAIGLTAG